MPKEQGAPYGAPSGVPAHNSIDVRKWPAAIEEYGALRCPDPCGCNYVHIELSIEQLSGDAFGWRVPAWCENGHPLYIEIRFHKGETLLLAYPRGGAST